MLRSNRAIGHRQTTYVHELPLLIFSIPSTPHTFTSSLLHLSQLSSKSRAFSTSQFTFSLLDTPPFTNLRINDPTYDFSAFRISRATHQVREEWVSHQIVSAVQDISEAFGRFRVHEPLIRCFTYIRGNTSRTGKAMMISLLR